MKIIECPRDAMQGMEKFIPTSEKVRYLNQLMKVGFDTIDAGSFVSPKAIPQMKDSAEVFEKIEFGSSKSKLLAIVANVRGAEEASRHSNITYLGFPLSISETFQKRNTNKSIAEALETLNDIQEVCVKTGKVLVTYISMGFGNPYNDPYDISVVGKFVDILSTLEIEIVSLADTIGVSKPDQIKYLVTNLTTEFPFIEFGVHLHSNPATAIEKIQAAVDAGCKRFDGAINGFGGCPMAEDELVGNLATETILSYLDSKNIPTGLDQNEFVKSMQIAAGIF
ncbi:MAG: hydroxymethylglutaryl-CoA lyase [Cyclobacteriaceae bacterium]|nr:hydroxymethylglutaryl-CoA lyase [Cyclobacteriaceae bacterium]